MFRKLTPFEHHKSFMPFDYLFMTKEQYEEFIKNTKPADEPVVTKVIQQNTKEKTELPIFYIDIAARGAAQQGKISLDKKLEDIKID